MCKEDNALNPIQSKLITSINRAMGNGQAISVGELLKSIDAYIDDRIDQKIKNITNI